MAISSTSRTHLIYQFIILTMLFLAVGYNELLPDRKFILLAFLPMFCYQLLILSCFMELMPVPRWMNLGESRKMAASKTEKKDTNSQPSSPESSSTPNVSSQAQTKRHVSEFGDLSDRIHSPRRWEKSVVNLGASPKIPGYPQKSKSWVNLSDSNKSVLEKSLSREGSLDCLAPLSEKKLRNSHITATDKLNQRKERGAKAKSWKPNVGDIDMSDGIGQTIESSKKRVKPHLLRVSAVQQEESELTKSYSFPFRKKRQAAEQPSAMKQDFGNVRTMQQDPLSAGQPGESELSKSYSFPFRQKRRDTWLEMKETETRESNQSLDMPYWQTVGYNLAVKYEARRRRRAVSSPTTSEATNDFPLLMDLQRSVEIPKDFAHTSKQSQKKTAKLTSNCINKLKTSFSNLISKKKDEESEKIPVGKKVLKPTLSFKSKNKIIVQQSKKEDDVPSMPEFPPFLSNDRPFIFYPKHIPFEKERFESDVQKKIVELAEEQKVELKRVKS